MLVRRSVGGWLLVLLSLFGAIAPSLRAQTSSALPPATLPAGWQQMATDDFAAAVRVLYAQARVDQLSPADHDAVRAEGKSRFSQIDLNNSSLSYQTLEMLHWLCRFNLDQETVIRTRAALLARKDDWAGQPFAEVWAKYWMLYRLKVDDSARYAELRKWVAAGGTLAQIPPTELHHYFARQCLVDGQFVEGAFGVTWNGQVTAPQSGNYVFSISPINVNAKNPHAPVKFSMTVSVNGNQVLDSSPGGAVGASAWVSASAPVSLTGGQAVPLKVAIAYEGAKIPGGVLHAILSWQGPGMAQTVIPSESLTRTNGGSGLQATYSWTAGGQAQTLTRTEPNVDVAWAFPPLVLAQNTTPTDQAADLLWQTMTAGDFVQTCLGPPLLSHPFFREPDSTSSALTSARRSAFHALLLQNPALLDALKPNFAVDFYQNYRFGAPDAALDVFGTWAGRNADLTCAISSSNSEFDDTTRRKLAIMAMLTTLQMPSHAARLQNEFLQTSDGRCSLPVAYTLAASYHGRQKLQDWTAFLDSRLNDTALTGDLRVNWLIARAEAEEIRQLPQDLDIELAVYARSRALDGKGYLDQALQAAQTPAVKARVAREIAARLAWGGQHQPALDLLQQTSQSLPADQQTALATLQTQIAAWKPSQTSVQDQAKAAKQAYLKTLQERRDQAVARGDTASVNRYNGLISAASGQ